ncbi:MAG TPA: ABC transporter substrate-binding protein [Anaerolineaceae bacterium]|nr:ABC transporter substrate-binding protein [Anaerolineaceae bacterium]HQJ32942.1 ABC transporter substrate-binding protein [Anaerolineaceae bacterium]
MKKIVTLLAVLILLALPACQAPAQVVETAAPSGDTYPLETPTEITYPVEEPTEAPASDAQVTIDYARNFTLEYKEGYKLLTVLMPWAGATEPIRYALVPKGQADPSGIDDALIVHTPVESFVSLSTTYLPFLEQIDELSSLVAVDSGAYIYNAEVQNWLKAGAVAEVGSGAVINIESLIDLNPDLIMTSASGFAEYDSHPQLLEAGLKVVINSDYLEQDPLGRAEWGKFIAAFFEKEAEADRLFDEMVARYQQAKALTSNLPTRVTVFTNTAYEGTWYMPGGESYIAILLADAGADYLFKDIEGSGAQPLDFEVVLERAKDADYWINVGALSELSALAAMDARYADFRAFQEGKVYTYSKRMNASGAVDYFESGAAAPDVILMDLIKAFYPDLLPEHEFFYYQALQ